MKTFVSLGEIMLRLNSKDHLRLGQANELEVNYGGGEANVAVSLANYGAEARFVTKLPKNPLADAAIRSLKSFDVDTKSVVRGGERMGIYFLETGASMRPSKVVYDRKYSAISEAHEDEFDYDKIFENADWFHFTGITPALGAEAAKTTKRFLVEAKKRDITVSCDLNYRKKLWTEEQAREVMIPLMEYVDVLIGNEEDAEKVLGFTPKNTSVEDAKLNVDGYKDMFKDLMETFNFKYVVSSLRESHSASINGWSGLLYDGKDFYQSKKYEIHLVDRVGGGDSFAGGLIHGLINDWQPQDAIEYAVGASALKQTIFGDVNRVSVDEVMQLIQGDGSGRVQR